MAEKEQPKKNKPKDEKSSEQSAETPMDDLSPGEAEDRCLLSPPPPAGAEALPEASTSRASTSRESTNITGMIKRYNPFKPKKAKKRRLSSSLSKVFRKTFRKSDSQIKTPNPEPEKRPRKISDPTDYRVKVEPVTESDPETRESLPSASTSKEAETKTEHDHKSEKTKSKGFFSFLHGSTSKEASAKPVSEKESKETKTEKEETKAVPEVKKKPLSPKKSDQPSLGNVSVGFFNEGMIPSESSGVPTESTSIDTKSGSSYSPDTSSKRSSTKRPRAKDNDHESSFSD